MLEWLRRAGRDEGQASIEYVALVLLVAAALAIGAILVPGSLRHTVLAGVKSGIVTATCRLTGGACPQPGGSAGGGGDGGGGPAVSAQDPGQQNGQQNGQPDGQPALDPQQLPYYGANPADNLQLAAYPPPPGGGGAGDLGSQAGRLPGGGNYPFVPKKGQNPDNPKSLTRHSGRFVDKYGNEWQWDPQKGEWDVQHKVRGTNKTTHTNVGEDGEITHGDDNFPKQPKAKGGNQGSEDSGSSDSDGGGSDDKGGDTAKSVAVGVGAGLGIGGLLWWGAKVLSPACGPFVLVCAVVF